MKTRRRQVRERIRRNRWRRRRRWYGWDLGYDIGSVEIRIGGVLLNTTGYIDQGYEVLAPRERAQLNAGDWRCP